MKSRVARVSVSVPQTLLKSFDEATRHAGYADRSKAVQVAMRNMISELGWLHERGGVGVCTTILVYDHHVKGIEEALTDVQHRYPDIVSSAMHHHIDEHNCLQVITAKGGKAKVGEMLSKLGGRKGLKQVKHCFFTPL